MATKESSMELHAPFMITPRLLPGVQVDNTFISIEYDGESPDGRTIYRYYIDGPDFEATDSDLKSGVGGGGLQEGMVSLLSFLGAAAESYKYRQRSGRQGENEDLFPPEVVEWAAEHEDDLSMLQLEIEESEEPLIDE